MLPDLKAFRWIVINSSGGKDSQTALRQVVLEAHRQGVPKDRLVVSHQCLGSSEWPGTLELARAQAGHYGLRFETSKYRDKGGNELSLLDYVRKRGKWPASKQRFCTSEFKRGPGNRIIVRLCREVRGDVLQIFGFRAEESTSRKKKLGLAPDPRASCGTRRVMIWLPIHKWSAHQVWQDIRNSGVPYHQAYDLGMKRLSCVLCIYSPVSQLMIAGRANPGVLDRYAQVEKDIGHRFRMDLSLAQVQQMIKDEIEVEDDPNNWSNM